MRTLHANTGWRTLRDFATWAGGIALLVQQVWVRGNVQPTVAVIIAGMIGLPFIFRSEDPPKPTDGTPPPPPSTDRMIYRAQDPAKPTDGTPPPS